MADNRKAYNNWPQYDDDLVNKIYVDERVEGIESGDIQDLKQQVQTNTQNINTAQGEIINLNNNKLDTSTYDTFIEDEYTPLAHSVDTTVAQVDVEYYLSDSNLTPTGGSWSTTAPAWVDGKYMWSRQKVTYVDGTYNISNTTCIAGATGATGADGRDGTSVTITSTEIKYQQGDSGTITPTGTWSSTVPVIVQGKYLWTRTIVNYSDNTSTTSYSVAYNGENGQNGQDGHDGTDGQDGTSSYTYVRYSEYSDGTDFSDTPSNSRIYIGVYTGTSSTAPSSKTSYTWSKYKGDKGDTGDTGPSGSDGNGINSITYYYKVTTTQTAPSASSITSTTIPTMSETDKYLWQKEVIDFTDPNVQDKTTVLLIAIYGDKGTTGATGTGIDSLTEEYAMSNSKTTAPTSGWTTTQPSWSDSYYIWTRTKIVYKNPTSTEYTTPVCSTVNDAYDDLTLKINGKIESFYQSTDPSTSWSTSVEKETHVGDIWYDTVSQKTFVYYKDTSINPVTYYWQWQDVPIELIDSVNGKATIYSGIIPTNYKAGDYWIVPLNCFSNTTQIPSAASQTGEYSVGMELQFGDYTLYVDGVNSSHKITSYHTNVPNTSNYNIGGTFTNDDLTLTITSTSNFTLPTNCYGGSVCIATSDSSSYNYSTWIPRNDYVPADLAGRYSLASDVNTYIENLNGTINSNYNNLDGKISDNYNLLDGKIDSESGLLNGKINDNYDELNGKYTDLDKKADDIDTKYDGIINGEDGIKAQISKLNDRIIANIQGTGGNNLLRNSVGFRQKNYWTEVTSGGSTFIEQEYKTFAGQNVTISFRYKNTNSNNIQILLGKYVGNTFTTIYTLLNESTQRNSWTDFYYSYTSSINTPVLRINSTFTGVQDNDAESNGASGSKLVFSNGLIITDLMVGYGDKQPWTPYYNEVYGKRYNLDQYGLDIRDSASDKYSHLDSNSLDFRDAQNNVESVFSKAETKTDNIYIANSIRIGNLHIIKLDDNNIIEY